MRRAVAREDRHRKAAPAASLADPAHLDQAMLAEASPPDDTARASASRYGALFTAR